MNLNGKDLLTEIQANHAALANCKRHQFSEQMAVPLRKYTCLQCGGNMSLIDIGNYIRGYEAAGGVCDDIWPNWR